MKLHRLLTPVDFRGNGPRLQAQVANEGLANGIIAARQKNAQLMQQYSWNCRVEVLENGAIKDTWMDQCVYGPNNQIQRTLINDSGSPLPHDSSAGELPSRSRRDHDAYLKKVLALLDQYTLPTAGRDQFHQHLSIAAPGPTEDLQFSGGSVVQPETPCLCGSTPPLDAPRKITVVTTDSDGNQVNFTNLPDLDQRVELHFSTGRWTSQRRSQHPRSTQLRLHQPEQLEPHPFRVLAPARSHPSLGRMQRPLLPSSFTVLAAWDAFTPRSTPPKIAATNAIPEYIPSRVPASVNRGNLFLVVFSGGGGPRGRDGLRPRGTATGPRGARQHPGTPND